MSFQSLLNSFDKLTRKIKSRGRKTILFAPVGAVGHVNALLAIAKHLQAHNHRIVFLFGDPYDNNLADYGFEVYDCSTDDLTPARAKSGSDEKWVKLVKIFSETWSKGEAIITHESTMKHGLPSMIEDIKRNETTLEKKVGLIKPDIIVIDHFFAVPALFKLNLPWILIWSAGPLILHSNSELPHGWLGLPTRWDKDDPRQKDWCERAIQADLHVYDLYNQYWKSHGFSDLPKDPMIPYLPLSPYLNIYMYPEELDYSGYPLEKWVRCDSLVRDQRAKPFETPEKLRDKPGKLIFLSLGSLVSADVVLMKRLTEMLADCAHRFIVCKGINHDQYDLPDNMWGEKFVPQLEVLKSIDLIITHGGNNTLTESLYYGVPGYIVLPVFGDQHDNGTRIEEKGLGVKLDPYHCTKEQLVRAIDEVLGKKDIVEKVQVISKRMQTREARDKALKLVKNFVDEH